MLLLHLPVQLSSDPSIWEVLSLWELDPLQLVPLLVLGALYLMGYRRLSTVSHRVQPVEARRLWCFLVGYLALVLALFSPLHSFGEELFAVHMAQHLLLMSVAAPLLLLANPMPVALWAFPSGRREIVGRWLSPQAYPIRVLRLLTHPPVAWGLFVLNLWLWHQPAAYQGALEHEVLHYFQHLTFFGSAILFWWPVIGPAPLRSRLRYPARMLYVFLAWLPNSILGAGFTFAPSVMMPFYASRPRYWGIDPLTDQQLAGLIMWLPGDAIYAAAMLVLLLAILRQEDRREAAGFSVS